MAIPWFLAQTSAEFLSREPLSEHMAWMACHFSPYGRGLSNLPPVLPSGSLLILNDRIPMAGHDPRRISEELARAVDASGCFGVLLDFQRPGSEEAASLAARLSTTLPCPVAVSDLYAKDLDCPVFLCPCPHHVLPADHIAPWKERRLWLDLAVNAETITLTAEGSRILPLPLGELPPGGHREDLLHCHYAIETSPDTAQFTLWRTREDLEALAAEAEALEVEVLVGLYCELGEKNEE